MLAIVFVPGALAWRLGRLHLGVYQRISPRTATSATENPRQECLAHRVRATRRRRRALPALLA